MSTLADYAMRNVNATTAVSAFTALSVACGVAGAKGAAAPDHRPLVTPASPKPDGFPIFRGCLYFLRNGGTPRREITDKGNP